MSMLVDVRRQAGHPDSRDAEAIVPPRPAGVMKAPRATPAEHLAFLLSAAYDGMALNPEHRADLDGQPLRRDDSRAEDPPSRRVISQLAGFTVRPVRSACHPMPIGRLHHTCA